MALHLRTVDVGSNIGQYRILKKLGAGGMGTVYLGEHILLRRRAAIKTLLPTLSQHAEIVERFFTEARATSAISDPGVVQIFDFGYHVDGTAYIVMELLEGEALAARIERLGRLRPSDALRIARQVASSLAAAHDCGILHRDLKPENIFLIHDPEAQAGERTKILDFGICKLGGEDVAGANDDAMIGTPVYMSPEQCRGISNADARSDIYALGCVLFDMLTGRPPFEGNATAEYIAAHMSEEAPAPSAFVPDLPPIVDPLLARLLAKDPEERFQTMGDLVAAIEHVAARLSAPGIVVAGEAPMTPAMPLPSGFSSIYQDNAGDDYEPTIPPRPRRSFARVLFAMLLSGVVVIALLAAYDSILADRAAAHAPPVAVAVPDPAPAPPPPAAAEPDPDPVPNVAEIDRELDKLLESTEHDDKPPSLKLPEDKTVQKPVARARQPVRRAVPAPPKPPQQAQPSASRTPGPIPITPPSTPTPTEDLYDSR
jgi:serine/threonine protein kinase